jgi:hypothetical protein
MVAGNVADRTGDDRLGMEFIGDRDMKQAKKYLKRRTSGWSAQPIRCRRTPNGRRKLRAQLSSKCPRRLIRKRPPKHRGRNLR